MPLDGIAGNRELIDGLVGELGRRPSHAYLFSGPPGIGRAAVAAGLAQSLLCERSPGPRSCCMPERCATRTAAASTGRNRGAARQAPRCDCCASCVQVALGVHPDFTSVARQPNRVEVLIEQVGDVIERVGLRPWRGDRRVGIIDDAETLNLPAQNALLKTLEEPPGHTIIFMVTQSERALLDTVRSRMRPVRFGPLTVGEIAAVLAARAGLDADRANALARLARRSLSHALSLSEGDAPPLKELLQALSSGTLPDFAAAQSLAQDFFASREQAVDNFELIARLLEEMLCFKLLRENPNAPSPEAAKMLTPFAERVDVDTLANLLDAALKSGAAIDAMANSRLQAEQW